jgi:hypothetical protein
VDKFIENKDQPFISGKHYTIKEKSYRIHTFSIPLEDARKKKESPATVVRWPYSLKVLDKNTNYIPFINWFSHLLNADRWVF